MSRRIYIKKNSRKDKWWVQWEYNVHMYDNRWQTKLNNNTHETHKFTQIDDIYVDTKNAKKFVQKLRGIAMQYWYTHISRLDWREQYIDNYAWKYNQTLPDSRMTSAFNNMACNVGWEFPQAMYIGKIKTKLHNLGLHYWRWWHPSFSTAFLCRYFLEGPFNKIYWFDNMRWFMVNVEKQPQDIVKLFNRWYVLIQQRIAKIDFEEWDMRKAFELSGRGALQKQNYEKMINTFGQYDTTHFTTIYYNKKEKTIDEIGNRWDASITNNLRYKLQDWVNFVKKGYISPNLFFIAQAIED